MTDTEFDGDWLGRMMEDAEAKAKAPINPAQTASKPPVQPVKAPKPPATFDTIHKDFQDKVFSIDGIQRYCYFAFPQGTRDIYWLKGHPTDDNFPAYVFDADRNQRERLLNKIKAGEDLQPYGNLNSKPRI